MQIEATMKHCFPIGKMKVFFIVPIIGDRMDNQELSYKAGSIKEKIDQ